jgi:DNA-binding MarR family transcriptional regulator
MLGSYDPRWGDDPRDAEDLAYPNPRERAPDDSPEKEVARVHEQDASDRDAPDPRDVLLDGLDLPRGAEREAVSIDNHTYELNGEDSRNLATVGAFRVVSESELRDPRHNLDPHHDSLDYLRDEGLVETIPLDERERGVVLTERGRELLEVHRPKRDARGSRSFGRINRRELTHDASVYDAYRQASDGLRDRGADIRGVIVERELKREYQRFLQEGNRDRPDSDGRPDRDDREIEEWAREHDLPYFDDRVHFPDVRIEYELEGERQHLDVEVVTPHYRGAHGSSRVQCGFSCYASRGGRGGRSGGLAEQFL